MKRTLYVAAAAVAAALAFGSVSSAFAAPLAPYSQEMASKSDKPLIVIVTGDNCGTCADTVAKFEAYADKHPGVTFAQANAADVGVPAEQLPFVAVIVPGGAGITYRAGNFAPADMDAVIAQRVDFATREAAAAARVNEIAAKIAEASKPFDEEMAKLETKAQEALAPIQAEAAKVMAPFNEQRNDINTRAQAALADLRKAVDEAKDDTAYVAARKALAAAAKPFQDEMTALRAKMAEAMKPFQEQAQAALKPLQEEAAAIETRKTEATASLTADLEKAQTDFYTILEQDQEAASK